MDGILLMPPFEVRICEGAPEWLTDSGAGAAVPGAVLTLAACPG
jgi:hypothetical protein